MSGSSHGELNTGANNDRNSVIKRSTRDASMRVFEKHQLVSCGFSLLIGAGQDRGKLSESTHYRDGQRIGLSKRCCLFTPIRTPSRMREMPLRVQLYSR